MKKILGLIVLVVGILFQSCHDDPPPIGDPFSKLEGINGSFVMNKVVQIDERAKIGAQKELDISAFFIGTNPPEISFNSSAFTYTLDPGDAPNYLGNGGSWKFYNEIYPDRSNDFPEQVILNSNGDEIVLALAQPILPTSPTLEVKVIRYCSEKPGVSYQLIFNRK